MMKWVGLTGGIGSGKSTVSRMLRDLGYVVIDADQVARDVVQPGQRAYEGIVKAFGTEVLNSSGEIDRKRLARRVFSTPKSLKRLEEIVHPEVKKVVEAERLRFEKEGKEILFYEVPLLFEKGLEKDFDETVLVYCLENLQRARLKERDHFSDEEIEQRLAAQLSLSYKFERSDFVINNNGSLVDLKQEVQDYLDSLIKRMKTAHHHAQE